MLSFVIVTVSEYSIQCELLLPLLTLCDLFFESGATDCKKWKVNGWKGANNKPIANQEVVQYLSSLVDQRKENAHSIELRHTSQDSCDEGNKASKVLAGQGRSLEAVPEVQWAKKIGATATS